MPCFSLPSLLPTPPPTYTGSTLLAFLIKSTPYSSSCMRCVHLIRQVGKAFLRARPYFEPAPTSHRFERCVAVSVPPDGPSFPAAYLVTAISRASRHAVGQGPLRLAPELVEYAAPGFSLPAFVPIWLFPACLCPHGFSLPAIVPIWLFPACLSPHGVARNCAALRIPWSAAERISAPPRMARAVRDFTTCCSATPPRWAYRCRPLRGFRAVRSVLRGVFFLAGLCRERRVFVLFWRCFGTVLTTSVGCRVLGYKGSGVHGYNGNRVLGYKLSWVHR